MRAAWFVAVLLLVLAACAPGGGRLPAQQVGEMRVSVETRPWPPRAGMTEFLVYVDRKKRGFINDLVVMIRTKESDWQQAIPDGALGVYRRALKVGDPPKDDVLFVRLRWWKEKEPFAELRFPLKAAFAEPRK